MKKNVASQVIGAQMVSATDGSAFTGAVTVYVTGDGGTQGVGSVGSGACAHEGNGFHTYVPAQAETNYGHIGFTFIGTGAVPATVQVYTDFPQTGDAYALETGGGVRVDWSAIQNPTATVALTGTTLGLIDNAIAAAKIATGAITAAKFAADAIDAAALKADAATEIAAAVKALVIETNGNITVGQALSVMLAFAAGVSTGQTGTSPAFKDPSGTSTRIAGTTDGSGNRSAVTLTPSS